MKFIKYFIIMLLMSCNNDQKEYTELYTHTDTVIALDSSRLKYLVDSLSNEISEEYDTVKVMMLVSYYKAKRKPYFINGLFSMPGYEVVITKGSWREGLVIEYLDKDMNPLSNEFTVWDKRNINHDN